MIYYLVLQLFRHTIRQFAIIHHGWNVRNVGEHNGRMKGGIMIAYGIGMR